jgi:phage tail-like protein
MTQAASRDFVELEIVSTRLPEAEPALLPGLADTLDGFGDDSTSVLLIPGEESELLIRLGNLGDRDLNIEVQVTGNFPAAWCQVTLETSCLAPDDRKAAILTFVVPEGFFEGEGILGENESLNLNYWGRLEVYGNYDNEAPRLLEFEDLELFVRPTSPYLEFLPQIYREVDFVGRFLKIIEMAFKPDLEIWENLWAYLDPLTAPEAMLPFLAHWVGWEMQPYFNPWQQRRLIRYALEIYRVAGTRRGLRLYLHLATGLPLDEDVAEESHKHIQIYETFSDGFVLGQTQLGQDAILGGGQPYHFVVRLRRIPGRPLDEALVRRGIGEQKPAFCSYELNL